MIQYLVQYGHLSSFPFSTRGRSEGGVGCPTNPAYVCGATLKCFMYQGHQATPCSLTGTDFTQELQLILYCSRRSIDGALPGHASCQEYKVAPDTIAGLGTLDETAKFRGVARCDTSRHRIPQRYRGYHQREVPTRAPGHARYPSSTFHERQGGEIVQTMTECVIREGNVGTC